MNLGASDASASDEIQRRLAAAAQAVREQDLCRQQRGRLSAREQTTAAELETARQEYAGAEKDVGRLEHLSLTRVLSALHGSPRGHAGAGEGPSRGGPLPRRGGSAPAGGRAG